MGFTKESFRRTFPHLATELEKNAVKVSIGSVRSDTEAGERVTSKKESRGYSPDIMDFLRRCSTLKEAKEIIDFMEKRGEISHEYAKKLCDQLREKGVRSFGAKKRDDYYFYYFKQIEKSKK